MKKFAISLVLLLLIPMLAFAQAYSGQATSVSGQPIPYAKVTVCSGQTDVLIQNPYQICNGQAPLLPPSAPTLTAVSGSNPSAGTYGVEVAYVNSVGQTVASASSSITTSGGTLAIQVTSPASYSNATGWNVYFTTAGGSIYYQQNSTPTAIGTNYTQSAAISTSGANPPTATTATNNILPAATVYSNVEQTVVVTQPITADANGRFTFFSAPAAYTLSVSATPFQTYSYPITVQTSATNFALKNASGDNIQYVSTTGADTNDGLSWGTAKLTVGAACVALGGNSSCTTGSGAIMANVAPSAFPSGISTSYYLYNFKNDFVLGPNWTLLSPSGTTQLGSLAAPSFLAELGLGYDNAGTVGFHWFVQEPVGSAGAQGAFQIYDYTASQAALVLSTGTPGGTFTINAKPVAGGTAPTITGTGACASVSSQKGGWAGQISCTGTTGASTLIITPGSTAPNGWSCWASDVTHTLAGSQSAVSTTACTMTFTSVSASDVLTFGAIAY